MYILDQKIRNSIPLSYICRWTKKRKRGTFIIREMKKEKCLSTNETHIETVNTYCFHYPTIFFLLKGNSTKTFLENNDAKNKFLA